MADDPKRLFQEYGKASFDAERLAGFYSDFAVASTPEFLGCLKGKDEVLAAFKQIADYQKQTGLRSMTPEKVEETEIDNLHTWAKVTWNAMFEKTGDRVISFDISYLLRRNEDGLKILLYISHQDEMAMRQELGLLP